MVFMVTGTLETCQSRFSTGCYATGYWLVDNSKARSELGMEFRSARDILAETLAWLRGVDV